MLVASNQRPTATRDPSTPLACARSAQDDTWSFAPEHLAQSCCWKSSENLGPGSGCAPDGDERPDCAYGDSPEARLTPRRQPGGHTDVLATGRGQKWTLAVASRRVCRPAVASRRVCPSSPARLTCRRQLAAQTVHLATRRATDCASGDNQGPFRAARCRRTHSLGRGLSPDAQFGVAGRTRSAWLSGGPARDAWRGCLRPSCRRSAIRNPSTPLRMT